MKNKGFTIIELLVTVGLVGIITTIAVGTYKVKFPTAQVKEPVNMLEQQRLTITTGISQGYCTPNNNPITMKGKYGVITVSGTLKPSAGQSCPSGCQAKYTFNGSDVSKELQGKIIVVDVLNNLKMSKVTAQTTVDDKYLPKNLIAYSVNAGDSCTAIAATTATATSGGGTSGTENAVANGSVIPGEPVVPTPTPTPTPTTPTAPPTTPTTPTAPPTTPTTPTTPPPNPNGRANLFPYTVNTGLALYEGIQIAMIPLNLSDSLERGYFDGTLSTSEVVTLHNRMGSRYSSRKGMISVRGSGSVNQQALVGASSSFIVAFVINNARCPTVDELRANGFMVNFSCDLDPSGFYVS